MAKVKTYLRVAKRGQRHRDQDYKVVASTRPDQRPLESTSEYLPTAMFCLVLDIPDEMFRQAERELAEVKLTMEDGRVAAEVVRP